MELARRIGIINRLVSDYEKGKLRLYDQMVARFALALNVSTDEILGLKNGQEAGAKPSLKIMRRMKALEGLPLYNRSPISRRFAQALILVLSMQTVSRSIRPACAAKNTVSLKVAHRDAAVQMRVQHDRKYPFT